VGLFCTIFVARNTAERIFDQNRVWSKNQGRRTKHHKL